MCLIDEKLNVYVMITSNVSMCCDVHDVSAAVLLSVYKYLQENVSYCQ